MSDIKTQYDNLKVKILNDKSIYKENRDWIKKVLDFQERKGKRKNGLSSLDEGCYKTLLTYCTKLRNVIGWFNNKPLNTITEKQLIQLANDPEVKKRPKRRMAYVMMFYQALRVSEVVKLNQEDYDPNTKLIHIKQAKGSKDRKIPINPYVVKIIKHLP